MCLEIPEHRLELLSVSLIDMTIYPLECAQGSFWIKIKSLVFEPRRQARILKSLSFVFSFTIFCAAKSLPSGQFLYKQGDDGSNGLRGHHGEKGFKVISVV